MKKKYDKRFEFITKTISRVGIFMMTSVLQLPPSLQDMGFQVTLFLFFGYLLKFHIWLWEINPGLAFLPSVFAFVLIRLLSTTGKRLRDYLSRTHPIKEQIDDPRTEAHTQRVDPPVSVILHGTDLSREAQADHDREIAHHVVENSIGLNEVVMRSSTFLPNDFDSGGSISTNSDFEQARFSEMLGLVLDHRLVSGEEESNGRNDDEMREYEWSDEKESIEKSGMRFARGCLPSSRASLYSESVESFDCYEISSSEDASEHQVSQSVSLNLSD